MPRGRFGSGEPHERRDRPARTSRVCRKNQRVPRLRNAGARPGFVPPLSSGLKKTENVHSESAKQSRLRVAHGRALRGYRRLSVPPLKFGRTPSLSARRRRRDRATSNFRFSTVLATLTRGFRSTMRDRPHLLRSKVRQLHQVSLRGMGASNSRYSGSYPYAVFQIAGEIEFLAFSAIFTVYSCRKEHTEKAR